MGVWVGVDVGGKRKRFDVAVIDDCRVLELRSRQAGEQVVDIVLGNRPVVVACPPVRTKITETRLLLR